MKHDQTWDVLEQVIDSATYTDDARFQLIREDESNYALLYIFLSAPNTYREDRTMRHTRHEFVVPVATYNFNAWVRWVFERIKSAVAVHEVCEWFKIDGVRPYPPHHGNGEDPYVEWHLGTEEQASKAPGDS